MAQSIKEKENYFKELKVDHCLDDDNNVIFLHLGRGTPKTTGNYKGNIKTSIEQWIDFAENKKAISLGSIQHSINLCRSDLFHSPANSHQKMEA